MHCSDSKVITSMIADEDISYREENLLKYDHSSEKQDDIMKLNDGKEQSQRKIGENSLESQEKKQFIKYKTPLLTTSSSMKM